MDLATLSPDEISDLLAELDPSELDERQRKAYADLRTAAGKPSDVYVKYQSRLIDFSREVLKQSFSPDVEKIFRSVQDNRITIVRSANSVGKTHCLANLALAFYKCHSPCKVHTLAAPPFTNLETKLWGEISRIVRANPDVFKSDYADRRIWISRQPPPCEEFIEGITVPQDADPYQRMASVSGSHSEHQLYLVDEGDGVPDAVYDGIETCMTGPHERLVICFNPRNEGGRVYELEQSERANVIELSALRHPHVKDGVQTWPGAVTREVTVKRIQEQTRPLAPSDAIDGECFEIPDYLMGEVGVSDAGFRYSPLAAGWRKVIEHDFWHIVLGKYSPKGSDRWYFDGDRRPWLRSRLDHWQQRTNGQLIHEPFEVLKASEGPEEDRMYGTWEFYEPPIIGHSYVIGADVAKGVIKQLSGAVDNDFNEAVIYDRGTLKQVGAGWGRDGCSPEEWAGDLCAIGKHFNYALLIVEVNNHGRSTLNEIINHRKYPSSSTYYRKCMKKDAAGKTVEYQDWGFETTETTKALGDGYLRGLMADAAAGWGRFDVRSPRQIQQLLNYGKLNGGGAGALVGHDDAVTGYRQCAVVLVEMPFIGGISKLRPVEPITATGSENVSVPPQGLGGFGW